MPDSDGWITPKLGDLPKEGDRVEFESPTGMRNGNFQGGIFYEGQLSWRPSMTLVKRWRPIPDKPELPEFVKAAIQRAQKFNSSLTEFYRDITDETSFPHLAVVESNPEPRWFDNVISNQSVELANQAAELSRLREQIKREREAVEKLLQGGNALRILYGSPHTICWATASKAYRALLTPEGDAGT
jgi:hypothetical protein